VGGELLDQEFSAGRRLKVRGLMLEEDVAAGSEVG